MTDLNGACGIPISEFNKQYKKELVSEYKNSFGFIVREYFKPGLIVGQTIITTQLPGEPEETYTPDNDIKYYAEEKRLKSGNKLTLAEIYYCLLV